MPSFFLNHQMREILKTQSDMNVEKCKKNIPQEALRPEITRKARL